MFISRIFSYIIDDRQDTADSGSGSGRRKRATGLSLGEWTHSFCLNRIVNWTNRGVSSLEKDMVWCVV